MSSTNGILRVIPSVLTLMIVLGGRAGCAQQTQEETREQSLERLEKIAETYRIEIIAVDPEFPVEIRHGTIEGKPAEEKELLKYIPLFDQELRLYPRELVQRSRLKRVVICWELSFAGQRRGAIPDFGNDTLYLDISRGTPTYLRKVIHHEFYHIIDWQDDFKLYEDKVWAALNPEDFKYGDGGKNAQDNPDTGVLTEKFPGFLNHYSTTGVEEDKAEIFANLIVDAEYVAKRMEKEAVLESKAKLLKEQLFKFCPAINDGFWDSIQKTKRNPADRALLDRMSSF